MMFLKEPQIHAKKSPRAYLCRYRCRYRAHPAKVGAVGVQVLGPCPRPGIKKLRRACRGFYHIINVCFNYSSVNLPVTLHTENPKHVGSEWSAKALRGAACPSINPILAQLK